MLVLGDPNEVLVCADDVNLVGENINTIISIEEILLQASKEIDIEVNNRYKFKIY